MFPPEGEVALMFLKPYTGQSDDGLIDMLNGNATVSIKGENITVDNGLPDWLMYVIIGAAALVVILIIVIVVVVKRKRAMAEDDDGFYEDISNE